MKDMKHLLTGAAVAALVAIAISGPAEARMQRQQPGHHAMHRGMHYTWHRGGCCGPWGWGVHAPSDFVANGMNRQVMGQIGLRGALGLDQVALNPQPLPPRAAQ
jgi:hypothetical protein